MTELYIQLQKQRNSPLRVTDHEKRTQEMTNMIQPGEPEFDDIMASWWAGINQHTYLTTRLFPGTQYPFMDWKRTRRPDASYYYGLDQHSEEDFRAFWSLARHLPDLVSVQVITALDLTCCIDPELTHDMEIPGVWITRVTTVYMDTTIEVIK